MLFASNAPHFVAGAVRRVTLQGLSCQLHIVRPIAQIGRGNVPSLGLAVIIDDEDRQRLARRRVVELLMKARSMARPPTVAVVSVLRAARRVAALKTGMSRSLRLGRGLS